MSVADLNTLHTICEVERSQRLIILAMSVKKPRLAGFILTQNWGNFLYVEGSTAWLYDCPHHISPSYIAEHGYDKIPVRYLDTVMYVDPITRQTLSMLIKSLVKTIRKMLFLLTQTLTNIMF